MTNDFCAQQLRKIHAVGEGTWPGVGQEVVEGERAPCGARGLGPLHGTGHRAGAPVRGTL